MLTLKKDAVNEFVKYEYNIGGALKRRTWARGSSLSGYVDYEYDGEYLSGDLLTIAYPGNLPDVTFTHDRLGRIKTVTDTDYSVHTFTYDGLQLASEAVDGLSLDYVLTPTYQTSGNGVPGRASGLMVGDANDPDALYATTWDYDSAGRLDRVTGPGLPAGGKVEYSRVGGSDLIGTVAFQDDQTERDSHLFPGQPTDVREDGDD